MRYVTAVSRKHSGDMLSSSAPHRTSRIKVKAFPEGLRGGCSVATTPQGQWADVEEAIKWGARKLIAQL